MMIIMKEVYSSPENNFDSNKLNVYQLSSHTSFMCKMVETLGL